MKYLVKTIKHTTGEEFTDIIRVKNNEDYIIIEAENKEEAERIAKRPKGLLSVVSSNFNSGPVSRDLSKTQRGTSKKRHWILWRIERTVSDEKDRVYICKYLEFLYKDSENNMDTF